MKYLQLINTGIANNVAALNNINDGLTRVLKQLRDTDGGYRNALMLGDVFA